VTSLVSGGCIISGAALRRSLLFTRWYHLHSFAKVENAVILPYVDVGEERSIGKCRELTAAYEFPGWTSSGRRTPELDAKTIPDPLNRASVSYYAADDRRTEGMRSISRPSRVAIPKFIRLSRPAVLADVVGALPVGLERRRNRGSHQSCRGFPDVMQALGMAEEVLYYPNLHGGIARLLCGSCGELDIFVIDAPHLYARLGNPLCRRRTARIGPITAISICCARTGGLPILGWELSRPSYRTSCHAHGIGQGPELTHAYLHYSERPPASYG